MRAAWMLPGALLLSLSMSGCLGIDNMHDLQAALGMLPAPAQVPVPLARAQASLLTPLVGQVVAFSSLGSEVFQGRELVHAWDFGDGGRAQGAEATHRFARAGLFTVRLEVTNEHGVGDTDEVLLTVLDNKPPIVGLTIGKGPAPVTQAFVGDELAFAARAEDPEGQPVRLLWDFGDGATAITPDAKHRYERGGRYLVTLRAEDPSGLAASVSQELPIAEGVAQRGRVDLLNPGAHTVPVGPGAGRVLVTLTFDGLYGVNSLHATLRDAQQRDVQAAVAQAEPLAGGPVALVLDVAADVLGQHAPGDWSVVVRLQSGVQVDYDLTGQVEY